MTTRSATRFASSAVAVVALCGVTIGAANIAHGSLSDLLREATAPAQIEQQPAPGTIPSAEIASAIRAGVVIWEAPLASPAPEAVRLAEATFVGRDIINDGYETGFGDNDNEGTTRQTGPSSPVASVSDDEAPMQIVPRPRPQQQTQRRPVASAPSAPVQTEVTRKRSTPWIVGAYF